MNMMLSKSACFCLLALGFVTACKAPAPADTDTESCKRWTTEVCKVTTKDEEVCEAVKATDPLLTPSTCSIALAQHEHLTAIVSARAKRCGELSTRLCQDVGSYTRQCKMVRAKIADFGPERCTQMLAGYADVVKNLKQQAVQHMLPADKAAKLLLGEPPALGPVNAKVQLVEFVDFEDHDCIQAAQILRELEATYADRLRVVVRQFPLPYNPHAHLAAEAALAAQAQGKFWQLYDMLLANQKQLERADLDRYAKELGLDATAFASALDKHQYAAAVDADTGLAHELSVTAMPTMFLDGERLLDAVDKPGIVEAIEEHLARPR